jgi:hypothetical protein
LAIAKNGDGVCSLPLRCGSSLLVRALRTERIEHKKQNLLANIFSPLNITIGILDKNLN